MGFKYTSQQQIDPMILWYDNNPAGIGRRYNVEIWLEIG